MRYANTLSGHFLSRPNRFIACVEVCGELVAAHVKNTGRCKELLLPGTRVVLERSEHAKRKTAYSLIAVWKGERLVNIDSQAPNKAFLEYLQSGRHMAGITRIKPEAKHGGSRFDFYVETTEENRYIEVKGVTLEEDGIVLFPDAPTERGVKHLRELAQCVREGDEAEVVFVIQMSDVRCFTPNHRTHPAFGEALAAAENAGVKVLALDCTVTESSLTIGKPVERIGFGGKIEEMGW